VLGQYQQRPQVFNKEQRMERVNHAVEAIRVIDAVLLEEELVLESLKGFVRTSEEVDARLWQERQVIQL
jgi:glycerol-3-phosphate cytidylyltransferase-like family protein